MIRLSEREVVERSAVEAFAGDLGCRGLLLDLVGIWPTIEAIELVEGIKHINDTLVHEQLRTILIAASSAATTTLERMANRWGVSDLILE